MDRIVRLVAEVTTALNGRRIPGWHAAYAVAPWNRGESR